MPRIIHRNSQLLTIFNQNQPKYLQVWNFSANFALLQSTSENQLTMNDHTKSLIEFYVQRISAMEAALKAAESERDALLKQLLEKQDA